MGTQHSQFIYMLFQQFPFTTNTNHELCIQIHPGNIEYIYWMPCPHTHNTCIQSASKIKAHHVFFRKFSYFVNKSQKMCTAQCLAQKQDELTIAQQYSSGFRSMKAKKRQNTCTKIKAHLYGAENSFSWFQLRLMQLFLVSFA